MTITRWIAAALSLLLTVTSPVVPSASATDVDRAEALLREVVTTLSAARTAARDAKLEQIVIKLDALPDACCLGQKVAAHSAVNQAYRKAGVATRLGKHSLWLIDVAAKLTPELRARHGRYLYMLHIETAEAHAGRGENDKVRELTARARTIFPDAAGTPDETRTLDRFALLDRPAPPITASRWLNLPAGQRELSLTGGVTLVEFSAHWCAPCEMSYPALRRLHAKYRARGFRVVIVTSLYGYYKKEKNLAPEIEVERDRAHFEKAGLTGPIAISDSSNPASAAYRVGGIPQIHLVDATGTIRLLMLGWGGTSSEASLDSAIARLLR